MRQISYGTNTMHPIQHISTWFTILYYLLLAIFQTKLNSVITKYLVFDLLIKWIQMFATFNLFLLPDSLYNVITNQNACMSFYSVLYLIHKHIAIVLFISQLHLSYGITWLTYAFKTKLEIVDKYSNDTLWLVLRYDIQQEVV